MAKKKRERTVLLGTSNQKSGNRNRAESRAQKAWLGVVDRPCGILLAAKKIRAYLQCCMHNA